MKTWRQFILGCTVGNVLEVYDFILYGYFANIISTLFFPKHDHYTALLLTFGVFASGCLMRPFGAIFFGHIGDKFGRKQALLFSIGFMTISTVLIGVLPTYQTIGAYAPVLLVICRMLQGFSICGEETGAAIFLTESAPKHRHALASSIIFGSIYFGLFLGSVVTFILSASFSKPALYAYGWRIPFAASLVFGVIAMIIRKKQIETPDFEQAKKSKIVLKQPVLHLFKNEKLTTVKTIGLVALMAVIVYILAVYMPAYFNSSAGLSLKQSMLLSSIGFFCASIFVIVVGYFTDKVGHKTPIMLSIIGSVFLSYFVFQLFSYHSIVASILAEIITVILLGLIAGSIMPVIIHSFPVNIRSTGVNMAFNIGMTIFGSSAPLICLWLTNFTHNEKAPCLYVIAAALLTLLSLKSLKQKHTKITRETTNVSYANIENGQS